MRTNKLTLMKPVVEINIDAELIEDKIVPLNKSGKLNVIKCMFSNLRTLASALQPTRCDISDAINAILSGDSIDLGKLGQHYVVAFYDVKDIKYDAHGYDGHVMVTFDNSSGELSLCGFDTVNLRSDDIEVVERIPHNIPIDYNDYSDSQLLAVINHVFMNMRALATTLEHVRMDITNIIDSIAAFYTNPAIEMTLANIGSSHRFDIRWNWDNENTPYIVFDRRDNHIYLYRLTIYTHEIPNDHLKMPLNMARLMCSSPAVRPTDKLVEKFKKNPSILITEKLYVRGEPARLGDPRFARPSIRSLMG